MDPLPKATMSEWPNANNPAVSRYGTDLGFQTLRHSARPSEGARIMFTFE